MNVIKQILGIKSRRVEGDPTDLRVNAELLTCPVCFEIFVDIPLVIPCGHTVCKSCLSRLTGRSSGHEITFRCPLCRHLHLKGKNYPKNYTVESILDSLDEWVGNKQNTENSERNCERIAIERMKKKTEVLTTENAQLKQEIERMKYNQWICVILVSGLSSAVLAYFTFRGSIGK